MQPQRLRLITLFTVLATLTVDNFQLIQNPKSKIQNSQVLVQTPTVLTKFLPFLDKLSEKPAQVNAIAGIGLDRAAFANFPNHSLSNSIQGSLLDVFQVNNEQHQWQQSSVYSVGFSPNDKKIVSSRDYKTIRLRNATTSKLTQLSFKGYTVRFNSVAFSPDGKKIVNGTDDNTVRLWDALTGKPIGLPLTGHTYQVYSVGFSPDGKRIVSGSMDKTVRLWDALTGKPIGQPLTGHTWAVYSVRFSPDGKRIVSGSGDNTVRLWDALTGKPIGQPLTSHTDAVMSVAFSPDGKRIVSGSEDNTVRLWDATGKPIGLPLTGHTDKVYSVAFSPDGKQIVSGSWDDTIRLWDASTGKPIGSPFTGHQNNVNSVAFSLDGKQIISGSWDNTVRLWDASTGKPIGLPLTGHTSVVSSVAFSPDGKLIVSGGWDNTIHLWDATTRKPVGLPFRAPQVLAQAPDATKQKPQTFVKYSIIYNNFKREDQEETHESELYILVTLATGEKISRKVDLKPLWQQQNTSLEDLVAKSRESISKGPGSTSTMLVDKLTQRRLQQLYQLLIQPITDLLPTDPKAVVTYIHTSDRLLGLLSLFPLLQDEQGKFLYEKHAIRQFLPMPVLPQVPPGSLLRL